MDISCPYGQPVLAPADGIVTYADFYNGYGRMLQIDHGNGISTRYGHLSGFAVTDGQSVRKGQVIAYVGLSGRSTGPHLHYEVRIHDTPVNPHKFLRGTSVKPGGFPASYRIYFRVLALAVGALCCGGFCVSGPISTVGSLSTFLKNAYGTFAVSTASLLS